MMVVVVRTNTNVDGGDGDYNIINNDDDGGSKN